jgi:hypothetical protein
MHSGAAIDVAGGRAMTSDSGGGRWGVSKEFCCGQALNGLVTALSDMHPDLTILMNSR